MESLSRLSYLMLCLVLQMEEVGVKLSNCSILVSDGNVDSSKGLVLRLVEVTS